jgi:hypothetical protein
LSNMVSEDNEEPLPFVGSYDPEALNAIRDTLGITADELPPENILPPVSAKPKRRRGRPRKYPISETGTTVPELAEAEAVRTGTPLPPAKLTKRNEHEVAERLSNMLMAGTGIASQAKPYLAMTEEEAKAIAEPLSSYLVRNADTIVVAQQVLENYDLLAIVLGVLAYTVRIYRDRNDELAELRASAPVTNSSTLDRISQLTSTPNAGQEVGINDIVSSPYGTGNGTNA